ncbi:hypothetical protein CFA70_12820 [Citrobacter freundii]|nr:hypothetical protein CFA70_12820 [Citrobacter freundii]
MVILVGLAIDQIAQSGLSSLSVIYYSAQLFRSSISLMPARLTDKLEKDIISCSLPLISSTTGSIRL